MRRIAEDSFADFSGIMSKLATSLGVTAILRPGERTAPRRAAQVSVAELEELLSSLAQSHTRSLHALLGASRTVVEAPTRRIAELEAAVGRETARANEERGAAQRAIAATNRLVDEMQLQQDVLAEQQAMIKAQHETLNDLGAPADVELQLELSRSSMRNGELQMQLEERAAHMQLTMRKQELEHSDAARRESDALAAEYAAQSRALETRLSEHQSTAAAKHADAVSAHATAAAAHANEAQSLRSELVASQIEVGASREQAATVAREWTTAAASMDALRLEVIDLNESSEAERDAACESIASLEVDLKLSRTELAAVLEDGHAARRDASAVELAAVEAAKVAAVEAAKLRNELERAEAGCFDRASQIKALRHKCAALGTSLASWTSVATNYATSSESHAAATAEEQRLRAADVRQYDEVAAELQAEVQDLRLELAGLRAVLADHDLSHDTVSKAQAQQAEALRTQCAALRDAIATLEAAHHSSEAARNKALQEARASADALQSQSEAHDTAVASIIASLSDEHNEAMMSAVIVAAEEMDSVQKVAAAQVRNAADAVERATSESERVAGELQAQVNDLTAREASSLSALHMSKVVSQSQLASLQHLVAELAARQQSQAEDAAAEITRLKTHYAGVVKEQNESVSSLVGGMRDRHQLALTAIDRQHSISVAAAVQRANTRSGAQDVDEELQEHVAMLKARDTALMSALAQKKAAFQSLADQHRAILSAELGDVDGARVTLADAVLASSSSVSSSSSCGGESGGALLAHTPAALHAQVGEVRLTFEEYRAATDAAWSHDENEHAAAYDRLMSEYADEKKRGAAELIATHAEHAAVVQVSSELLDALTAEHTEARREHAEVSAQLNSAAMEASARQAAENASLREELKRNEESAVEAAESERVARIQANVLRMGARMVGTDIRRRFMQWKAFLEMKRVEKRQAAAVEARVAHDETAALLRQQLRESEERAVEARAEATEQAERALVHAQARNKGEAQAAAVVAAMRAEAAEALCDSKRRSLALTATLSEQLRSDLESELAAAKKSMKAQLQSELVGVKLHAAAELESKRSEMTLSSAQLRSDLIAAKAHAAEELEASRRRSVELTQSLTARLQSEMALQQQSALGEMNAIHAPAISQIRSELAAAEAQKLSEREATQRNIDDLAARLATHDEELRKAAIPYEQSVISAEVYAAERVSAALHERAIAELEQQSLDLAARLCASSKMLLPNSLGGDLQQHQQHRRPTVAVQAALLDMEESSLQRSTLPTFLAAHDRYMSATGTDDLVEWSRRASVVAIDFTALTKDKNETYDDGTGAVPIGAAATPQRRRAAVVPAWQTPASPAPSAADVSTPSTADPEGSMLRRMRENPIEKTATSPAAAAAAAQASDSVEVMALKAQLADQAAALAAKDKALAANSEALAATATGVSIEMKMLKALLADNVAALAAKDAALAAAKAGGAEAEARAEAPAAEAGESAEVKALKAQVADHAVALAAKDAALAAKDEALAISYGVEDAAAANAIDADAAAQKEGRAALLAQIGVAASTHQSVVASGRQAVAATRAIQAASAKADATAAIEQEKSLRIQSRLEEELGLSQQAHEELQRGSAAEAVALRDELRRASELAAIALAEAIANARAEAAAELAEERATLRARASEFAMSALEQLQTSQRRAAELTESITEQRATALELAGVEYDGVMSELKRAQQRNAELVASHELLQQDHSQRTGWGDRLEEVRFNSFFVYFLASFIISHIRPRSLRWRKTKSLRSPSLQSRARRG